MKLNPNDLIQHRKKLTHAQIRSIAGNVLSAAEKKLNKNPLTETIVNKINKLIAHYDIFRIYAKKSHIFILFLVFIFGKDITFLVFIRPGCTKTLIARAIANQTDLYFISINGPKILKENGIATDVLDSLLEIKVEKMKGPIEPGQEPKIDAFVQKLNEFA
jgi:hypothetical protein